MISSLRIAAVLGLALLASSAVAQETSAPSSRHEERCVRYKKAWDELIARRGMLGLGQDFLESHAAFLAGGCQRPPYVCPRSNEELAAADAMSIAAANANMGSTFPPFACRR